MYKCRPSAALRQRHRRFRRAEQPGPARPNLATGRPSCAARVLADKRLHTVARRRQRRIQLRRRRRRLVRRRRRRGTARLLFLAVRVRAGRRRPRERLPRLRPDCMGRRHRRRLARAGDARPAIRVHPDSDHHLAVDAAFHPGRCGRLLAVRPGGCRRLRLEALVEVGGEGGADKGRGAAAGDDDVVVLGQGVQHALRPAAAAAGRGEAAAVEEEGEELRLSHGVEHEGEGEDHAHHHAEGAGEHAHRRRHAAPTGRHREHVGHGGGRLVQAQAQPREEEHARSVGRGGTLVHDAEAGGAGEGDEWAQNDHGADAEAVGEAARDESADHYADAVGDEGDAGLHGVLAEGPLEEEDHVVGDGVAGEGHEGAGDGGEGEDATAEDAEGDEGVGGEVLVCDEGAGARDAAHDESDEGARLGQDRVGHNSLDHGHQEEHEARNAEQGARKVEAPRVIRQRATDALFVILQHQRRQDGA